MSPKSNYQIIDELRAENSKYRMALMDIASSEAIPTAFEAWKFCKEVAMQALPDVSSPVTEKTDG